MARSRTRKTTPSPMPDREILNIDGAAAFLGVSVKTFSKVLREGDVPGRKVGREWKFSRQALIDWVGGSRSGSFLDGGDEEAPAGRPIRRPARTGRRSGAGSRSRKVADDFSVDDL
ncbi:MAG: helix-turn-helix domain-containing protein [Planctomycetota bacterium]|jgi:excisionase family DNA binding protein